ncbi:hypothetical protein MAA5396_02737 [Marinovum algicola]|jgi:hypothetical protein|nr:hypothetical protein MAA5396_02737 [Marinovum algicola]
MDSLMLISTILTVALLTGAVTVPAAVRQSGRK